MSSRFRKPTRASSSISNALKCPGPSFWWAWVWRGGGSESRTTLEARLLPAHFRLSPSIYRTFIMLHRNLPPFGCLLWIVNLSISEQFLKQFYFFFFLCSFPSMPEAAQTGKIKKKKKIWGSQWNLGTLLSGKKMNLFPVEFCLPACLASSFPESGSPSGLSVWGIF